MVWPLLTEKVERYRSFRHLAFGKVIHAASVSDNNGKVTESTSFGGRLGEKYYVYKCYFASP